MSYLLLFRGRGGTADVVVLPSSTHIFRSARRCAADADTFVSVKHPADVVDYEIDWSGQLGGDTIVDSRWGVPTGLTGDSGSNTSTTTTIWVSSGTADTDYGVLNRITTTDGRVLDCTLVIPVRNK